MRFALAAGLAAAVAVGVAAAAGNSSHGVPRGFRPETAAAVGPRDLWVVGDSRCRGRGCLVLVRSTDAGRNFTRVGLPASSPRGAGPVVVFANAREGFFYLEDGSPLYVTDDGGASWHRTGPHRDVVAFALAGGYAYMIVGGRRFERSPIGRNAWRALLLPFPVTGGPVSLAARGSHLWVMGTGPLRKEQFHSQLGRSVDRGSRFAVKASPCYPGLPSGVIPAGRRALWAVCSSGMMASLSLSKNDGRSFAIRSFHDPGGLRLPSLTNAAAIAPASARVAVLTRGAGGAFLRTTDAGRHWSAVRRTARIQGVSWLAFTTRRIGAALVQMRSGVELWRTTDGGATWHSVPIHR